MILHKDSIHLWSAKKIINRLSKFDRNDYKEISCILEGGKGKEWDLDNWQACWKVVRNES